MSLVRTALRLAVVNALRGATIAETRVYDSRVDDFSPENYPDDARPTIIVLTDEESGDALSEQNGGPPFRRFIDLVIEFAMVQRLADGDDIQVGYPVTDSEHEASLDLLEFQIARRLAYDPAPESVLYRSIISRVHKHDCHRQVLDETGVKIAARVLTWTVQMTDDRVDVYRVPEETPPTGLDLLPEPLRAVAKALPAGNGLDLCKVLAAALDPLTVGPLEGMDVTTDNIATGEDDSSHKIQSTIELIQPAGDPYAQYLLYDDFSGFASALDGRVPNKGPAWIAEGTGYDKMTAGGGKLYMPGGDSLAGYARQTLPQNAGKLTAKWQTPADPIIYPATMAIGTGTNVAVDRVVHGEIGATSFFFRLIRSGPVFVLPAWYLYSSPFSMASNTEYLTELYVEGKWARMVMRRTADNSIVGTEYAYDPAMQTFMGTMSFWEMLDSKLEYHLATAEAVPVGGFGGWPALDILKETNFSSGADGFAESIFGGVVTPGQNKITVTCNGYGQGTMVSVGNITAGDRIWFSMDISNMSYLGLEPEVALIQTSGSVEQSDVVQFNADGRVQGTLTATASGAMSLIVTVPLGGNQFTLDITEAEIIKNPPTAV